MRLLGRGSRRARVGAVVVNAKEKGSNGWWEWVKENGLKGRVSALLCSCLPGGWRPCWPPPAHWWSCSLRVSLSVIAAVETAEIVGGKVCSDRDRHEEAKPFRLGG